MEVLEIVVIHFPGEVREGGIVDGGAYEWIGERERIGGERKSQCEEKKIARPVDGFHGSVTLSLRARRGSLAGALSVTVPVDPTGNGLVARSCQKVRLSDACTV